MAIVKALKSDYSISKSTSFEIKQSRIDLIARWLHYSTEPFDDWEWDGEELSIYLNDRELETYS